MSKLSLQIDFLNISFYIINTCELLKKIYEQLQNVNVFVVEIMALIKLGKKKMKMVMCNK